MNYTMWMEYQALRVTHDTFDGFTWKQAKSDLARTLKNVPPSEIDFLIEMFEQGAVDGRYYIVPKSNCGCIIGWLGFHKMTQPVSFSYEAAYHFFNLYGGGETIIFDQSAFQSWLMGVHQGDTPKTNKIAAAFVRTLRRLSQHKREALETA